jgi:hypothetical protein
VRLPKAQSALVLDDTLCEHVGSLFEYIDRHYNHGDDAYPLAHNPFTSHYVSGPVWFPVDLRLYRRYEEMTRWEEFVRKHFPDREIPKRKKERAQFHKVVDPVLLQDPDFQTLDQQFRTKIALAIDLLEAAIRRKLPFSVVLFDNRYLAEDFVAVLQRRKKDWISILKKNRNLETDSFVLKDAAGKHIPLDGPHLSVEDLVPLIPPTAYRAVTVGETTYWTFTLAARIPSLGKVRLVISFEKADLTGTSVVLVTNRVDWTALRVIATYLLRWPTESSYRCAGQVRGWTTSPNPAYRFVLLALSFVLLNIWTHLRWLFTQVPRRGRRGLDVRRFRLTRFAKFLRALEQRYGCVDQIVALAAPLT